MGYKILKASDVDALSKLVTKHMEEGWMPHGQMVILDLGWQIFYQPIVKYGVGK